MMTSSSSSSSQNDRKSEIKRKLSNVPLERLLEIRDELRGGRRRTTRRRLLMNNKNDPTTSILGMKAPKSSTVFKDTMYNSPNYESTMVAPMGVPTASGKRIPIRDQDPSMEGYSPPMGYGTQTPMCDVYLDKWLGCSTDTVMDPTMDNKMNKWKERVWNAEEPNPSYTASYAFSNMVEETRKSLRKDHRVAALVPSSPMGMSHPADTLPNTVKVKG